MFVIHFSLFSYGRSFFIIIFPFFTQYDFHACLSILGKLVCWMVEIFSFPSVTNFKCNFCLFLDNSIYGFLAGCEWWWVFLGKGEVEFGEKKLRFCRPTNSQKKAYPLIRFYSIYLIKAEIEEKMKIGRYGIYSFPNYSTKAFLTYSQRSTQFNTPAWLSTRAVEQKEKEKPLLNIKPFPNSRTKIKSNKLPKILIGFPSTKQEKGKNFNIEKTKCLSLDSWRTLNSTLRN